MAWVSLDLQDFNADTFHLKNPLMAEARIIWFFLFLSCLTSHSYHHETFPADYFHQDQYMYVLYQTFSKMLGFHMQMTHYIVKNVLICTFPEQTLDKAMCHFIDTLESKAFKEGVLDTSSYHSINQKMLSQPHKKHISSSFQEQTVL